MLSISFYSCSILNERYYCTSIQQFASHLYLVNLQVCSSWHEFSTGSQIYNHLHTISTDLKLINKHGFNDDVECDHHRIIWRRASKFNQVKIHKYKRIQQIMVQQYMRCNGQQYYIMASPYQTWNGRPRILLSSHTWFRYERFNPFRRA